MIGDGACEMFGDYFDGQVENLRRGSIAILHGSLGFSNQQVEHYNSVVSEALRVLANKGNASIYKKNDLFLIHIEGFLTRKNMIGRRYKNYFKIMEQDC